MRARGVGRKFWGNFLKRSRIFRRVFCQSPLSGASEFFIWTGFRHADGEERLCSRSCATKGSRNVCESILRQHHNEETIPGRGVLKHANVLEESLRATSEKSGMMTRFFDRSISRLCVLRCSSVCTTGRKTVMRIVTKTVKLR